MPITVILFDLDGVLVDSSEIHHQALNSALLHFGYRPISNDEHRNQFNGLPTKEKLNRLVRIGRIKPHEITALSQHKQEVTAKLLDQQIGFDIEKFALFCALRMMDYKIGIVSNAIRKTVQTVCDKLYLTELLDEIISNEDGRPKPAPDLYLKAMEKLTGTPQTTLVIEDGYYGEQAARAAGIEAVMKVKNSHDVTPTSIFKAICNANSHTDGGQW